MTKPFSRRDWIKTIGVASTLAPLDLVAGDGLLAAPTVPDAPAPTPLPVRTVHAPGDIVELYSTSDVFIPPRGPSFMKFSFDFPEPGVVFGDHRFSFLVFTDENTYALDRALMTRQRQRRRARADVHRAGLGRRPGEGAGQGVTVRFTRTGRTIEWDIVAEMAHPIKTVTTVIRDMPRGKVSFGGGALNETREGDVLGGYTFGAGDLHGAGTPQSMTTPVADRAGERHRLPVPHHAGHARAAQALLLPGRRDGLPRGGHLRARRAGATIRASWCRAGSWGMRRPSRRR